MSEETADYLRKVYKETIACAEAAEKRLDRGREYLMTVEADKITVEDCLVAFGWDRNGFEIK